MTATFSPAPAARVAFVKSVGSAERKTADVAAEIVAGLGAEFDPKARGAVSGAVHAWACGDAERPAVKSGPKGAQVSTDYGRGVDKIAKAVSALLSGDKETKTVLRVTLSGEGGGTAVIAPDHKLYAALVKLIGADA